MTRLLIINADDFGLSPGVNAGILKGHAAGVVTSTSLMVERPAAAEAADLARAHPQLSVGLHYDNDAGDADDPQEAVRTLAAQLRRFQELMGVDPTHLDSHHHVHTSSQWMPVFVRVATELGVPLRHGGQVAYLGLFWGQSEAGETELDRVSRESLLGLISSGVSSGTNEIGCHPARVTGDFASSYLRERAAELATLTSPGLRDDIEALDVRLVSFRCWRSCSEA